MPDTHTIVAEHRALRTLVDALRRETASVPGGVEGAWLAAVAAQLAELRTRLEAHFAVEEQSGLFDHLAEVGSENGPAASRLRREHDALRERLGRLCAEPEPASAPAHTLAARVRTLLDDLEAHEERENELITRSLDGSLAAAD